MQPKRVPIPSRYCPALLLLATMLFIGCSTHARTTSVIAENHGVAVEEFEADEFIGTPIIGDYDDNPDLDFVLEVVDGDRVFKIDVHEDAGPDNQELIEKVRGKVNFMEDRYTLRVIGYYSSEFKSREKEYGFLDLKCIVFFDEETGSEEAYFTDAKDSEFYTEGDVTIIYAPGHHYQTIHYPRYARPWWDTDGDGIPDRYDPWPLSYDLWYDYNLNYIPDWYDPYYIDYYPYWSHWNLGFWVGYRWYTPYYHRNYYPYGYTSVAYYNDYRTYTRLYDRRYVNSTSNPRRYERLDVKTEAHYRSRYGDAPRATSTAAGSRLRGYDAASRPDNRRLVTASSRARESGSDVKSTLVDNTGTQTPNNFSRNRSAEYSGAATTRDRTARAGISSTNKRKAASAATSDLRTSDRRRSTTVPRADRDLSRSSTRDDRAYKPATSSRNREISSGSSSTKASSSRTYRSTTSRQRSTSAPANRSRVTSSRRTDSSSSYRGSSSSRSVTRSRSTSSSPRASSVSRSRSSSRSRPAPSTRSAPSRSRSSSPAPSTRSAPSRSRSSSPAPSNARSSGGGSSRSSSGAQRSSSGSRRKR